MFYLDCFHVSILTDFCYHWYMKISEPLSGKKLARLYLRCLDCGVRMVGIIGKPGEKTARKRCLCCTDWLRDDIVKELEANGKP